MSMNLNTIVGLPLLDGPKKKQLKSISPSTSNDRQYLINSVNLSSMMTKPESQRGGSCQAFSATTFIESLLWKLTGEKEEFTDDEIYNIYFDAWRSDYYSHPCMPEIDAATRIIYRGDGSWNGFNREIWGQRSAGCYWLTNWNITNCSDNYSWGYVYHWIFHYNDPEHRKYHYPDKYSKICEKAKNYLLGNIYSRALDEGSSSDDAVLNPKTLKSQLSKYGIALQSSIPGHAVVTGAITPSKVCFDSSWSTKSIYWINMPYTYIAPYYSEVTAGGYKFNRCTSSFQYITNESKTKKKITIYDSPFFSNGGKVYGIESEDRFEKNRKITLIAIPNDGYFFKCWDDQFDTGDWQSNIREFNIANDISVIPWFTNNENDIYKVMHNLYIMSADNCDIICNEYSGELLTGNVPMSQPLTTQNTSWKYNSSVKLKVIPNSDCEFKRWNDGNTDNPRTFILTSDQYAFPIVSINSEITYVKLNNTDTITINSLKTNKSNKISVDFGD